MGLWRHILRLGLATVLALHQWANVDAQLRDRRVRWLSVQSEHFEVHYPEPLGVVARHALDACERSHARLSRILDHDVDSRVQVVLRDDTDGANGSATAVPYNQMDLFVTAPDDLATLGDFDDWLSLLITHEHTHVLHLDTISGLPAVVNAVLGKVYAPNLIQPRWFIEGLATHEESRESSAGRLRSSLFEMYMRMETLDDRLLRMDQLSSSVDRWPRGSTWYLYGSRFVDWIAEQHGREALTAISHEYGRRLVPYGVNRTAKRVTGRTFTELYADWQTSLRAHHGAVMRQVVAAGRVEGERITFHGEVARSPRWVDDESIVYFVNDGHSDSQLRRITRTGDAPTELVRANGTSAPAPLRSGRILYDALDAHRDIYFFYDLFALETDGRVTRLTDGRRARTPDPSPDGRRVVFTENGAGTTHLMVADLADVEASARVLVRSPRFGQFYTPRWSPDGRTIAASRWAAGGYRDIVLIDAETGDVRPVTNDRAQDSGPTWSPDGRVVYFSSDRTGIPNLYAYEVDSGALHQVTNVVAGAFSPHVSPNGRDIVYLGYTGRGFDLWRLPVRRDQWRPAREYVDDRGAPREARAEATTSRRYRAADTLYPRNYLVDFQEGAFGTQLGVTLGGVDIVGMYEWEGRVGVSLEEGYLDADVAWRFNRLPAPISARFFRTISPRGGLQVGGEDRVWIEDAIGGSISTAYTMPRALHSETLSVTYSLSQLRQAEPFGGRLDPNTPPPVVPVLGRLASLRAGWGYSDIRRRTYDMTPSAGRAFALSMSIAHPAIGSELRSVNATWSWRRYVEAPWAKHHVFAFRYGGGLSGGDLGRRGLFSVGGFPTPDIIDAFRDQSPLGGVALRGYPQFHRRGTRMGLVQMEYRIPFYRLMSGIQTLPVYLNRIYGSVFVDVGDAWVDTFDPKELRVGVGAELYLDFTLGYVVPFTFRIGAAYGLMDDAGIQVYYHLGVPF